MKATMEMSRTCVSLDNDVDNVDTMWTRWDMATGSRTKVSVSLDWTDREPATIYGTSGLMSYPTATQESPGKHRLTK